MDSPEYTLESVPVTPDYQTSTYPTLYVFNDSVVTFNDALVTFNGANVS